MSQQSFTVIIEQPKPKTNFTVLRAKRQLRAGDKVIFQDGDKQSEVTLNHASEPDTEGIMKNYQLIGWVNRTTIERLDPKKDYQPDNLHIVEHDN